MHEFVFYGTRAQAILVQTFKPLGEYLEKNKDSVQRLNYIRCNDTPLGVVLFQLKSIIKVLKLYDATNPNIVLPDQDLRNALNISATAFHSIDFESILSPLVYNATPPPHPDNPDLVWSLNWASRKDSKYAMVQARWIVFNYNKAEPNTQIKFEVKQQSSALLEDLKSKNLINEYLVFKVPQEHSELFQNVSYVHTYQISMFVLFNKLIKDQSPH